MFVEWPRLMLVFYEVVSVRQKNTRIQLCVSGWLSAAAAAFLLLDNNVAPLTPKETPGLLLSKSTKSLLSLAVNNPSSRSVLKKRVIWSPMSFEYVY